MTRDRTMTELKDLDILPYSGKIKTRKKEDTVQVWDILRKKWLILTPEEHVRQLIVLFLLGELKISPGRIAVERGFYINGQLKRFDLVIFDQNAKPLVVIECKAPHIEIKQDVFDQISVYNQILKAPYLIVTNGRSHYMCQIDINQKTVVFLSEFPNISSE